MEVLFENLHRLEVLFENLHRLEVLSKEIGFLTSFGQIQPLLETFVLSKETGLSGTVVFNSIFLGNSQTCGKMTKYGSKTTISNAK